MLAGTKILVVDDDMRNTFALSGALEEYGSEAVLAGNGRIAMDALEREENINLVVMDHMLRAVTNKDPERLNQFFQDALS